MQTTTFLRARTAVKICQGATPEAAEAEFANYEALMAGDENNTWTTRAVGAYFQPAINADIPASFIILAEASHNEYNEDGTQVPAAILP